MEPIEEIASLAARAPSLAAFREGVLDAIARTIAYDAALMHPGSPRVPLETAAIRGTEPAHVAASMAEWDRWAVELGRFRDVALASRGVASDRDAIGASGPARALFERAFGLGRRAQAAALVHLVVRERIVGLLVLVRYATGACFEERELELLRALAPAIAAGDALHTSLDDAARAAVPVRLACRDTRLTERQREIVEHVALGHTNAEIGTALGLSPNTVRNLLADAMKRLGAANRADVVRLAVLR